MKIHRLNDASALPNAQRYLNETRASIKQIEELLTNAEGFRQIDARVRLRNLAETASSVLSELTRTAVAKTVTP